MKQETYKDALRRTYAYMMGDNSVSAEQIEEQAASILGESMGMEESLDGALQVATDLIGVAGTPEQQRAAFGDNPEARPVRVVWGASFETLGEPDSGTSDRIMMIEWDDASEFWDAAERCAKLASELAGEEFTEVFEAEEVRPDPAEEPVTAQMGRELVVAAIGDTIRQLREAVRDFESIEELTRRGILNCEEVSDLWKRSAARAAKALAI